MERMNAANGTRRQQGQHTVSVSKEEDPDPAEQRQTQFDRPFKDLYRYSPKRNAAKLASMNPGSVVKIQESLENIERSY